MDSGWAVVLGAMIALVGSAVIPWVREAVSSRAARRRQSRDALAGAIRDMVRAVSTVSQRANVVTPGERVAHYVALDEALVALHLLLDKADHPIAMLTTEAVGDARSRDLVRKAFAAGGLSLSLGGWYRGAFVAREAFDTYMDGRAAWIADQVGSSEQ